MVNSPVSACMPRWMVIPFTELANMRDEIDFRYY